MKDWLFAFLSGRELRSSCAHASAGGSWAVEIEKRLNAMDRGESVPVDAQEAIERIRQSMRRGTPIR